MNPDMKRLCGSFADPVTDEFGTLSDEGREAIVRAVLTELRKPSKEMTKAGGSEEVPHDCSCEEDSYNVEIGEWSAEKAFIAMIDRVLDDPSDAEALRARMAAAIGSPLGGLTPDTIERHRQEAINHYRRDPNVISAEADPDDPYGIKLVTREAKVLQRIVVGGAA